MISWATCAAAQTGGLTLRQALERALAQAPEIAGARAEAADAAAGARTAAAGFSPQAFATTTPGYSSGLPVQVAGQVPAIFGLELHQSIYDPVRRAEALEAQARAQGLDAAAARSSATTARALILAYGRNRADRALADNARTALEAREAMARRVAALASEGRRTQLELEEADLAVARAKQTLVDRESEFDLDRLELAHLIDWKNGDVPAPAEDPLGVLPAVFPGDSLAAATAADPELAALAHQADSLDRAAYLQKRAWLPTIQGEARYLRLADYNNFDQYFVKFKNDDIAVGVSVVIPLWTGGRLMHGEAAAGARLEKVRADRRLRERDLELSVRRAEIELKRSESQAQLASRALSAAREALRVAQALAGEGRGEADDVDLRQLELSHAQDDRIRAEQGVLAARTTLLDLRGDLPAALLSPDGSRKDPASSPSR
ncbi:MAG TPA: TolC family protein [Thermoanaerobaculia bacterium]|nr:TolC family protein [Thermoanaerobaculia bacterium]